MKKIKILLLLISLPVICYGQFFGLGGQYSSGADGQFAFNTSFPTFHKKNPLNTFISSGLEFTTSGGAKMSGLNIKPIQISTFFAESLYNDTPFTFLLSVDGGYLFDFRHNKKNAVVITPNIYIDYKIFFIKAGYDLDVSHGRNQFFVRAGIGVGLGALKIFTKATIW